MARPNQEAIKTFMSITGSSEPVALQKIEEQGGNLNEAINACFSEGDRNTRHEPSVAAIQDYFMGIDHPVPNASHGPPSSLFPSAFNPFSIHDPNFHTSIFDSGTDYTSGAPFVSHPRQVRDIELNEIGLGVNSRDTISRPSAQEVDDLPDYGNDIEEEMIRAAIEASKRDADIAYPGDPIPPQRQSHLEDPELAHVISLSLQTAVKEKELCELGEKAGPSELQAYGSSKLEEAGTLVSANGSAEIVDIHDRGNLADAEHDTRDDDHAAGFSEGFLLSKNDAEIAGMHDRDNLADAEHDTRDGDHTAGFNDGLLLSKGKAEIADIHDRDNSAGDKVVECSSGSGEDGYASVEVVEETSCDEDINSGAAGKVGLSLADKRIHLFAKSGEGENNQLIIVNNKERNITDFRKRGIAGAFGMRVVGAEFVPLSAGGKETWCGFHVGKENAELLRGLLKKVPNFFSNVCCASSKRVVQNLSLLASNLIFFENGQLKQMEAEMLRMMKDEFKDLERDGFLVDWAYEEIDRALKFPIELEMNRLAEMQRGLEIEVTKLRMDVNGFKEEIEDCKSRIAVCNQQLVFAECELHEKEVEVNRLRLELELRSRLLLDV